MRDPPGASPLLAGPLVIAIALGWSEAHPARPILELVGDPVIDRGTMEPGTFGRQGWEIRNVGAEPLRLRTQFTSGRSGFSLWQGAEHRVAAGARIAVHLTWPIPSQSSQPFASYVILEANDPTRPRVRLRVVGRSEPGTVPSPAPP